MTNRDDIAHECRCEVCGRVMESEPPPNESWRDREKRLGFVREEDCTCLCRDDGSRDLSLGCPVHN